ncbi:MAG: CHASE2 domain-containing protein [Saprospiraceae bacterium]|nr:CHASE2 domain-containing protein [Saprospiraceae bacterium]
MKKHTIVHGFIYALGSLLIIFILHHLPVNQLFIDPFSEAIKGHDLMDIAISKFRNHGSPELYDDRILIINSGVTDRQKVAQTIDYLSSTQVKAIGIDLLFDSLYYNRDDTILHEALLQSKSVVLGFTFNEGSTHDNSEMGLQSDSFLSAYSHSGYVNLASNDGFSVRAFEPFHLIDGIEYNSFSVEICRLYSEELLTSLKTRKNQKEWINFKRLQPGAQNMYYPVNSSKMIHYDLLEMEQFLSDTANYEKSQFANKIVLIGFCGENEKALSMKDRYYTPLNEQYTGRSLPDMHGVVVHANIISMILDKDFIYDVSIKMIYLLSLILFLFNYSVFKILHHYNFFRSLPYIRFLQVVEFFIILAICLFLLLNLNIKLGFTFLATCVILSYEFYEIYEQKLKENVQIVIDELALWTQRSRLISKS